MMMVEENSGGNAQHVMATNNEDDYIPSTILSPSSNEGKKDEAEEDGEEGKDDVSSSNGSGTNNRDDAPKTIISSTATIVTKTKKPSSNTYSRGYDLDVLLAERAKKELAVRFAHRVLPVTDIKKMKKEPNLSTRRRCDDDDDDCDERKRSSSCLEPHSPNHSSPSTRNPKRLGLTQSTADVPARPPLSGGGGGTGSQNEVKKRENTKSVVLLPTLTTSSSVLIAQHEEYKRCQYVTSEEWEWRVLQRRMNLQSLDHVFVPLLIKFQQDECRSRHDVERDEQYKSEELECVHGQLLDIWMHVSMHRHKSFKGGSGAHSRVSGATNHTSRSFLLRKMGSQRSLRSSLAVGTGGRNSSSGLASPNSLVSPVASSSGRGRPAFPPPPRQQHQRQLTPRHHQTRYQQPSDFPKSSTAGNVSCDDDDDSGDACLVPSVMTAHSEGTTGNVHITAGGGPIRGDEVDDDIDDALEQFFADHGDGTESVLGSDAYDDDDDEEGNDDDEDEEQECAITEGLSSTTFVIRTENTNATSANGKMSLVVFDLRPYLIEEYRARNTILRDESNTFNAIAQLCFEHFEESKAAEVKRKHLTRLIGYREQRRLQLSRDCHFESVADVSLPEIWQRHLLERQGPALGLAEMHERASIVAISRVHSHVVQQHDLIEMENREREAVNDEIWFPAAVAFYSIDVENSERQRIVMECDHVYQTQFDPRRRILQLQCDIWMEQREPLLRIQRHWRAIKMGMKGWHRTHRDLGSYIRLKRFRATQATARMEIRSQVEQLQVSLEKGTLRE